MAFFDDLTPYSYYHPEEEQPGTVNVGWLDPAHPFPVGPSDDVFRATLGRLCERRVKQTRGRQHCPFCSERDRPRARPRYGRG